MFSISEHCHDVVMLALTPVLLLVPAQECILDHQPFLLPAGRSRETKQVIPW